MNNFYTEHIEYLKSIKSTDSPLISLYIPLRWGDSYPTSIFSILMKTANNLLEKNKHPKISIDPIDWDSWTKKGATTLGIFINQGNIIFLPVPVKMKPRVVVAKSFHIKPLITASNEYIDSLLIHFNYQGASLYRVDASGEKLIDIYLPPIKNINDDWPNQMTNNDIVAFLDYVKNQISLTQTSSTKVIGVTGSSYSKIQTLSFWKTLNLPIVFFKDSFISNKPLNAFSSLRQFMHNSISKIHESSVKQVTTNETSLRTSGCLNDLLKDIIQKRISNLCISLDQLSFGLIDKESGKVSLNKTQFCSNDDDLLDDLAELAIENGISVSVVPDKYLPLGKTFLAS